MIDVVQGVETILIDVVQGIETILIDVVQGIEMILSFHEVGAMRSMGHLVEEEGREDEMKIGGSHHQRESHQTGGMTEKGKGPEGLWMRRGHGGEMTRIGRGEDLGGVGKMIVGEGMLIVIGVELNWTRGGRRGQGEVAEVESRHLHSPFARGQTKRWMMMVLNWW